MAWGISINIYDIPFVKFIGFDDKAMSIDAATSPLRAADQAATP